MAPSFTLYLFPHSLLPALLLNLLLARLAASTLMNPSSPRSLACLPPTTPSKPTALDCIVAMLAFPHSNPGVDYHTTPATSGPSPNVVYNTALTSTGDPSSPYHLPRTSDFKSCRVTVRMAEDVQSAPVLWLDVQQYTMALIRQCVDDATVLPSRPGPRAGGSTSIGAVTIRVQAVGSPAGLGRAGGVDTLNRAAADWRAANFRIGAYYPPSVVAVR